MSLLVFVDSPSVWLTVLVTGTVAGAMTVRVGVGFGFCGQPVCHGAEGVVLLRLSLVEVSDVYSLIVRKQKFCLVVADSRFVGSRSAVLLQQYFFNS